MPTSRDEWSSKELEKDNAKILRFLNQHKDSTLTVFDIYTALAIGLSMIGSQAKKST